MSLPVHALVLASVGGSVVATCARRCAEALRTSWRWEELRLELSEELAVRGIVSLSHHLFHVGPVERMNHFEHEPFDVVPCAGATELVLMVGEGASVCGTEGMAGP